MKQFARALRSNPTDAEKILWRYIRGRRLHGFKFRRQQRIGPYITDFACLEKRLLIELDGGGHNTSEQSRYDMQRTHWLESEGYRVVRYWNDEIVNRTADVLEDIVRQLLLE